MILHLDIDCFFASAHRIDNPSLDNIPIAIGGRSNLNIFDTTKQSRHLSQIDGAFTSSILSSSDEKSFEDYFVDNIDNSSKKKIRGIITTASYEARKYGVKSAMPVSQAIQLCPHIKVIPPNYPLYHELSHQLKLLLENEIPSIEQFSIDEFFGDITGWIDDCDVEEFAKNLKQKVYDKLKIPVSIGISRTKWIAKLATNDAKPFGIKVVYQDDIENFTQNIPIKAFPGIGKGYQEKLQNYGISTLKDIKKKKELFYSWGKNGKQLYDRACGIDDDKISIKKAKQSIGLGRTFDPIYDRKEVQRRLMILCRHLSFIAHKSNHNPMTFALNIRYQYGAKSKSYINSNRVFNEQNFKNQIVKLFVDIDTHPTHAIIQVNLTLSNFEENRNVTMSLLDYEEDLKQSNLTSSMQKLRDKFGVDIIKSAGEL
jgi:DNA polymerase-4